MLQDGLILTDASVASNFQIQNGTSLPVAGLNVGELFFLTTGTIGLYVYTGSAWLAVGNSGSLSFTGDVTGSGTSGSPVALTISNVNGTPGSFGSLTQIPTLTVNAKGQVTASSSVAVSSIAITESQITDGSLLSRNAGNESITGSWTFVNTVTGVDPTISTHLATKAYVDSVAAGLDPKASVRVATTANITLSGTQTIDGVAVVAGDRVLVKNQTTGSQNGIYVVAAGAWARSSDFDGTPSAEVSSGAYTFVTLGTENGAKGFVLITNDPITTGTTSQTWTEISAAPTSVTASTLTGTTLAPNVVSSSLTSVGTLGSLAVTGGVSAGSFTGPLTGNASTASALFTPRTINGVSFDGTANITVPAAAGTLTGTTLAANVVTSSLTSVGTLSSLTVSGSTALGTTLTESRTTVTATATTTLNCALGNIFAIDLATNITTLAFTNVPASGRVYSMTLLLTQGTGGNKTVTWPISIQFTGNTMPVLATVVGRTDVITLVTLDGGTTWIGLAADSPAALDVADLVGTTLPASVVSSSLTSVGTITTGVWNGTPIANANLANSSLTIGSTNIALGATSTTLAGLTSVTSALFSGPLTGNVTGNASTATALQTSRTINGVTFNGTANIVVTADASTLTGSSLASGVTSSSLTSVGTLSTLTVGGNVTAADPSASGHLTTKSYVDNLVSGLSWKNSVRAGTTANITLSAPQTIDGIAVIAGDRVLVKNQTTTSQNGVYVVAAGAWTRAADFDASPTVGEVNGAAVFIREGTTQAETAWTQTAEVVTIGTDPITFVLFSATGGAVAKAGDTMTGQLSINTSGSSAQLNLRRTTDVGGYSWLRMARTDNTRALELIAISDTPAYGIPANAVGMNAQGTNGLHFSTNDTLRMSIAGDGTVSIPGALSNGASATGTTTTSVTSTATTTIDSVLSASFRTAKYIVQVVDTQFHAVEILVIHDGTTVWKTEYAEIFSGSAPLGTFDAVITSGNLILNFTATAATSKTVKVQRIAITV